MSRHAFIHLSCLLLLASSLGAGVNTGPGCGRKTGTRKENSARSLNQTRAFYADIRACRVSCGN